MDEIEIVHRISELVRTSTPSNANTSVRHRPTRMSRACGRSRSFSTSVGTSSESGRLARPCQGGAAHDRAVVPLRPKVACRRRRAPPDPTTLTVLAGWKAAQTAEFAAVGIDDDGWVFTDGDGQPIHPHALSQTFERIARRAGVPVIRLHDLRHTHATLLLKAGVPVKVVSERLGHANVAFTIQTYQHVLPGMQADAAHLYQPLTAPVPPRARTRWNAGGTAGGRPPDPGRPADQRRRPRS